jgi:hypothetical protein
MTEVDWLTSDEPSRLLDRLRSDRPFRRSRAGRRQLRRFACLCCRRIWRLIPDGPSRAAVEAAERFADGCATRAELEAPYPADHRGGAAASWAGFAARCATLPDALRAAEVVAATVPTVLRVSLKGRGPEADEEVERRVADEKARQCELLRDLVGIPFRPVRIDPAWRRWNGGCVQRLARVIRDEGRFDELPVLADALEDAGCDDPVLLDHCRRHDGHVPGCWALAALAAAG